MRAYAPVGWPQLEQLAEAGQLTGPVRACAVDPAWRTQAPDVDEEQWEYEAQRRAAAALGEPGGVVLALDADPAPGSVVQDGWVDLAGPVRRVDLAAVLTEDLAWFAVQEIPDLLQLSRRTSR